MIQKLNARERVMLLVVLAIVAVLLLSVLISGFRRNFSELSAEAGTRGEELESIRTVLAESDLWEQREVWLGAHQPRLESRERAGVELLEEVRRAATESGVTLERPEIGTTRSEPSHHAVSISVQTRSDWQGLVGFMNALQQPERFVVFEEANLRLDAGNGAQMIGRFRIAKWYAPGGGE